MKNQSKASRLFVPKAQDMNRAILLEVCSLEEPELSQFFERLMENMDVSMEMMESLYHPSMDMGLVQEFRRRFMSYCQKLLTEMKLKLAACTLKDIPLGQEPWLSAPPHESESSSSDEETEESGKEAPEEKKPSRKRKMLPVLVNRLHKKVRLFHGLLHDHPSDADDELTESDWSEDSGWSDDEAEEDISISEEAIMDHSDEEATRLLLNFAHQQTIALEVEVKTWEDGDSMTPNDLEEGEDGEGTDDTEEIEEDILENPSIYKSEQQEPLDMSLRSNRSDSFEKARNIVFV